MVASPPSLKIELPLDKIAQFCQRWKIARLETFGSVLRPDFRPDSDLDFLATFETDAGWSLLDRVGMKLELEDMLGRKVDLLNRRALEKAPASPRAQAILSSGQLIYERA